MIIPRCISKSGRHRWQYIGRHGDPQYVLKYKRPIIWELHHNTIHWCKICGAIGEKVDGCWCIDIEEKRYEINLPDGV